MIKSFPSRSQKIMLTMAAFVFAATIGTRAAPPDQPLLQESAITWLGAFAMDTPAYGDSWFGYAGRGLTFHEDPINGKTLFMEGDGSRDNGIMAQIKVPGTLSKDSNWNNLPRAAVLQPFRDATDGHSLGACGGNGWHMYGALPHNGRMIWSGTCWYAYNTDQVGTHGVSGFNLSVGNDFARWEIVAPSYKKRSVSGFLAPIPAEWQATLGGAALTGNGSLSLIGETSAGPAAFTFNPADIGNGQSSHPGTRLLEYGIGSDAYNPSCPNGDCATAQWNLTTTQAGVIFPPGYRTVLFGTTHGLDDHYCYGTTDCCSGTGPCDGGYGFGQSVCEDGKGPHTSVKRWQFLAYDALDLAAVKDGAKSYWEPKPYAAFAQVAPETFATDRCQPRMYGMAFDPAARRLYVSYDWGNQPTIQVFQIAPAGPPDATPPAPPRGLEIK